jgi:hypothetical protein
MKHISYPLLIDYNRGVTFQWRGNTDSIRPVKDAGVTEMSLLFHRSATFRLYDYPEFTRRKESLIGKQVLSKILTQPPKQALKGGRI